MTRRTFLKSAGAMAAWLAAQKCFAFSSAASGRRPNIVLFMVDDMGWQDTSLPFLYREGRPVRTRLNNRYRTPNMEALAKGGAVFTSAYASPVCSPSRCSLMSGMNAARHRVTCWTLGVDQPDRLESSGEGLCSPRWAVNGLQPSGTLPRGSCQPPWRTDDEGKFRQPRLRTTEGAIPYKMNAPYTNARTFVEALHDAGYFTIHCGKAHWGAGNTDYGKADDMAPSTPGADPRAFGFDVNIAGCESGGPRNYRGDAHYGNRGGYARFATPGLDENGYYERNVFLTDALTDKALRTMESHVRERPDQPFYLYLSHYALHSPLSNGCAWDASRSASLDANADPLNPDPKDGLRWNETERNYATLIKGMDDSLGAVMARLRELGIERDTLVLFMADNGGLAVYDRDWQANEPLRAGKGSGYEGGVREPCIVSWPGRVPSGRVTDEPIAMEDFYPTILEAAGVLDLGPLAETPEGVFSDGPLRQVVDGESFLKVALGERETVRTSGEARGILWHYPHHWCEGLPESEYNFYTALRLGRWKLVYRHADRSFELYDLETDLGERNNVAAQNPEVALKLRSEMARLLRERRAQMPILQTTGRPLPYPDEDERAT
jgi:arylsulfatase A-like enzyme